MILEHLKLVRGLFGRQTLFHGSILMVIFNKLVTLTLEYFQISNEFSLEVLLYSKKQNLDIHGLGLELQPIKLKIFNFFCIFF